LYDHRLGGFIESSIDSTLTDTKKWYSVNLLKIVVLLVVICRSSYLHKDSYLAQRKERTLGYEGRYRRTLSPSGLTSSDKSVDPVSMGSTTNISNNNATSTTGKLDTSLTPSGKNKSFHSEETLFHQHIIIQILLKNPHRHHDVEVDHFSCLYEDLHYYYYEETRGKSSAHELKRSYS
jgi:hypothetical protein